jgi:hypothetical protein
MTAEATHASCTRPDPAPLACLLPSLNTSLISTIVPFSLDRQQTMALDEAIDILQVLVPIAKAVPLLGAPVEGSLEALSKILEFAQVRHSPADYASLYSANHDTGSKVY